MAYKESEKFQIFQFWMGVDGEGLVKTERIIEMMKHERRGNILNSRKCEPYLRTIDYNIVEVNITDLMKPIKNQWQPSSILYGGYSWNDDVSKATLISNVEQMVYKDVFMNFMSAFDMVSTLEIDKFSDEQRKMLETILTRMKTPKNDEDDTTF